MTLTEIIDTFKTKFNPSKIIIRSKELQISMTDRKWFRGK